MLLSFRPNTLTTILAAITLWAILAIPYVTAPALLSIATKLGAVSCPHSQVSTRVTVCFGLVSLVEGTELEAVLRPELEARKVYGPGDINAIIAALDAVFHAREPITRLRIKEALLFQGFPEWRATHIASEFKIIE